MDEFYLIKIKMMCHRETKKFWKNVAEHKYLALTYTSHAYINMSAQASVPANVTTPNDTLVPFVAKMMEKVGSGDYVWFCEQAFTEAGDLAQIVADLTTQKTDPNLEWFCLYAQDLFHSAVRLADVLKVRKAVNDCLVAAKQSIDAARAVLDPDDDSDSDSYNDSDSDSCEDSDDAASNMTPAEQHTLDAGSDADSHEMSDDAGKRKAPPNADTPSTAKKVKLENPK